MRSGNHYWKFLAFLLIASFILLPPTSGYAKDGEVEEGTVEATLEIYGDDVAEHDITNTKAGQTEAKAVLARWQAKGLNLRLDDVKVYNFGTAETPDILVLPNDLQFQSTATEKSVANKVLNVNAETAITIKPEALDKALKEQTPSPNAINASWNLIYHRCLARKVRTVTINWQNAELGWMDTCFKVHKIADDGNQWRDYWQLEVYGTARSTHPFVLTQANIEAQKASTSTAMRWVDWSPRSDLDKGGCTSVPIGISAIGLSLTSVFSVCDKWDITKFEEEGRFRNSWRGSSWVAWWNIEAEREVAFMEAIWVSEGKTPVWNIYQNFHAATGASEY